MDENINETVVEKETLGEKAKRNWKKLAAGAAGILAVVALGVFVVTEFVNGNPGDIEEVEPTE